MARFYDTRTDTERNPRRLEQKLSDDTPLGRPPEGWTDTQLKACGLEPITETARPADDADTRHEPGVQMVDGTPTRTWTPVAKTQDEKDAEAQDQADAQTRVTLKQAVATLRQWSDQAENHTVTQGNAVATLQDVVDNLAVFYDRFADLLEQQYGRE